MLRSYSVKVNIESYSIRDIYAYNNGQLRLTVVYRFLSTDENNDVICDVIYYVTFQRFGFWIF